MWRTWAASRGIDAGTFLGFAHGRRTSETVRLAAPYLDAHAEAARLDALEEVETRGLVAFPGAAGLLDALGPACCAIVTSGTRPIATLRLASAGLPAPPVFITADDVRRCKPDPEGYRAAAARLGVPAADCVVVEDSPTGLAAARAAGMRAIAVLTTYPAAALAAADVRVPALAVLRAARPRPGAIALSIAEA